ncbi:MAG TPA: hypothetical protein VKS78_17230 [Roseiarcus sp.]|nr:hypothetical protein [Roseiarcus sp.]
MSGLRAAIGQIIGLFVDDAGLALLAILAIAIMTGLVKGGFVAPLMGAIALALGCGLALATSLFRAAGGTKR